VTGNTRCCAVPTLVLISKITKICTGVQASSAVIIEIVTFFLVFNARCKNSKSNCLLNYRSLCLSVRPSLFQPCLKGKTLENRSCQVYGIRFLDDIVRYFGVFKLCLQSNRNFTHFTWLHTRLSACVWRSFADYLWCRTALGTCDVVKREVHILCASHFSLKS
jgi:hypothetical protein